MSKQFYIISLDIWYFVNIVQVLGYNIVGYQILGNIVVSYYVSVLNVVYLNLNLNLILLQLFGSY